MAETSPLSANPPSFTLSVDTNHNRAEWQKQHPRTYRTLWLASVQPSTVSPLLPHPLIIASGQTDNPLYYSDGNLRPDDHYCVFHYALAGQGMFRYRDKEIPIPAGHAFLFDANDQNAAYWYPRGAKDEWRFVWISFAGDAAQMLARQLYQEFGPVVAIAHDQPLIRRLMSFKSQGVSALEMHPLDAMGLVMEVLNTYAAAAKANEDFDRSAKLIEQATQMINTRIEEPLQVCSLARELDVSREHLSRIFLKRMGMGPQEFILQQKIRLACCMLRETGLSAKQVGMKLGFDHPPAFARAFRRIMKMTPAKFRRHGTLTRQW